MKNVTLNTPAHCEVRQEKDTTHFILSGDWVVQSLAPLVKNFAEEHGEHINGRVILSLDTISRLDTAGALMINQGRAILQAQGIQCHIQTTNPRYTTLLETSIPVRTDEEVKGSSYGVFLMTELGRFICEMGTLSLKLLGFLGEFMVTLGYLIRHPRQMRWTSFFYFMDQVGVKAVPIVSMLTFLIGLVVAYMSMEELAKFGAKMLSIKLVEVAVFRELGVLITAIVVAGRSSSSFAAQIGSMVSNEEVSALRTMGFDPMPLLVVPRILALIVTLPMLVFVADVMGILGGAVAICMDMDMSLKGYLVQVYNGAKIWNFGVGLIKAPFCALAIGLVGCFQGFQATGSAESVGFLTTTAVVQAIFLVIVLDAIFAIFFTVLGI